MIVFIWLLRICRFKQFLTPIHTFISITAVLTALMYVMIYVEYDEVNKRGSPGIVLTIIRIIFSISCALLSRVLALLVFLGFKITKQHLSGEQIGQVTTLAVFFVLAMASHEAIVAIMRHMMISRGLEWASLLAYYAVGLIFFIWMLLAYRSTREELIRFG